MSQTQNYLTNYNNAVVPGNYLVDAIEQTGVEAKYFQATVAVLSNDLTTSTYLICKDIPADLVIAKLEIETDALTSGTSYSIGLYDSQSGAALAAGCYANNIDLHTASTKVAPLDGLAALTHEQTLQQAWALAGDTLLKNKGHYDLVLTANTPSIVAGSVTFRGLLIPSG